MMNQPFVYKTFTGKVKTMGDPDAKRPMDRKWESAIFKTEKELPLTLTKTGLSGDQVADTKNHGGPEKALFCYPLRHYDHWKEDLELDSIGAGAMGENLSVTDMDETTVCIGDTYRLGNALIQVSQPRRPCWKPARRFRVLDFSLRIQNTGLTGWYFRVLEEGSIQSGLHLELIERPYPRWTIAECNDVMYRDKEDRERTAALASCDLLAANWKHTLVKRLQGHESSVEKRVYGPNQE
ncbi:MOSC domain-containing protein [Bhargavaea ullalensis]